MKRLLVLLVLLLAVAGLVLWTVTFRPKLTAVERGRRIAERTGCFGCHGPEGIQGTANPGRSENNVPSFKSLMMYAKNEEEVREWIRDGVTAARAKSETWKANRKAGALRMPDFGDRLRSSQIEDLVAFVMAVSGDEAPEDSLAAAGRARVTELGCTGCHGAGGRFARSNPHSLKGYIPPWDGADFPELVRDRSEFEEWVESGNTKRFKANPIAMHFIRGATLHMPGYKRFLKPGDLDALWAYVQWLRGPRVAAASQAADSSRTTGTE
jgi:mono/diheme cytochrome c family protein